MKKIGEWIMLTLFWINCAMYPVMGFITLLALIKEIFFN